MATAASAGLASGRAMRPEDPEAAEPVDPRRLFQLNRQRDEELPHDEGGEDARRAEDRHEDQRPVGVDHAPA